jgi:hypothetical protein
LLAWLRAGAPPREVGQVCDGDGGVLVPDTGAPKDSYVDVDTAPEVMDTGESDTGEWDAGGDGDDGDDGDVSAVGDTDSGGEEDDGGS